jgi:hypothetical protein
LVGLVDSTAVQSETEEADAKKQQKKQQQPRLRSSIRGSRHSKTTTVDERQLPSPEPSSESAAIESTNISAPVSAGVDNGNPSPSSNELKR